VLFFPAEEVLGQHVAFRVDGATFGAVVDRLRSGGLPFGNRPEAPDNGRTDDFAGGLGRVFFGDPDGHLYEVVA
jgi:catechol 2,3-dioxygenase-like lactoylglutathione lyase family enzyme